MKHIVFLMRNKKKYKKALKEVQKSKYRSVLIQVYTSITDKKKLQNILHQLKRDFPNCYIIGATTAGEIARAKMYEKEVVISLSLFKKTLLKSTYTPDITSKSALLITNKLCQEDTKALILLSEGLHGEDYDGFIKGIKHYHPHVLVAGGLAGDNFKMQKTYVIYDDQIFDRGCVALSFSAKDLYADNRYNLNWYAVGKEFTITKADGKAVEEIDGENALELFKKYLGENIFEHDISSLPDFQFLYKSGATVVSRTPMRIKKDKIIFAAPIKEGQRVRFGFSNTASVISGAHMISSKIQKKPAEAIYIFSCIARKILLGEFLENEFKAFENIAPTAGFFTYGEFYSTTSDNALLNCTTTVLTLSEGLKKRSKKSSCSSKDSLTFKALTNFIEQTSNELNSNIHLLQQYKELVDKAFLVMKIDVDGNITYINDNFRKVSHCTKDATPMRREDIITLDEELLMDIRRRLKEGQVWRGQLHDVLIGKRRFFLDVVIMPIYNELFKIEEYIAIGQDITQEVVAKEKLKTKSRFIQAIFDNQESMLISRSIDDDKIVTVNRKFFEYFEFIDYEEFTREHKCIAELFIQESGYLNPYDHPNWIELVMNNPQQDFKVKMQTRYGQRIFRIKINRIENEYIINLDDITSLEEAIEKAHKSEEAKSAFLASMSHEIRTPLNGILGFADLLKKELENQKTQKYADIIYKSSQMLLHIVNDILDYSKIESGEMRLHIESCNLKEELESAALVFASLTEDKNIAYDIEIDPSIPEYLYCDSQRIKQIVNNLLSNAVKFTPEYGSISFRVVLQKQEEQKVTLLFSVEDSGIGISKEKQKYIFKPFVQADDSIDKKYGGTGLGLAISSQFLSLMGSSMHLKSKEGVGSCFFFFLELEVAPSQKKLPQAMQKMEDTLQNRKVLIVEDNQTNQLLLSILLQERNIAFDIANNGKQALNKIAKHEYALVFMDINMPVLDGISAMKRLRNQGFDKPIISLSANVMESDIEEFKKAGANDYLHKPIIPEKLDTILRRYLKFTPPKKRSKEQKDSLLEKFKHQFELLDEDAIKRLLLSFIESAEEILKRLQTNSLDYKTAHTIKGLAANFGFSDLASISADAEDAAKRGDISALKKLKKRIIKSLKEIVLELQEEMV
ncbi:sensory box histidine kinase/response regulator [hydrothermal vent metagenome]|uniref:histidine kinase n=1 Tax=hydrothermal vent metagenome TaxID=652676 RepID=A0A1W1C2Q4_9ZZZZ